VRAYLARRIAFALFLIVAVSSASLVLARLAPGDYADVALPINATPEQRAQYRHDHGLDQPILRQYVGWIANAARLDFGDSLLYGRPVSQLIPERAKNTAILALTALVIATIVGLALGVVTGSSRGGAGGVAASAIRSVSLVLLSMPPLLTSLFLVFVAARTGWLPIAGMHTTLIETTGWRGGWWSGALDLLRHLIVPAAAIGLPLAAMFERLQSQAMRDAVGRPFVVATLARGVPWTRVVWRDALKVALGPIASVYGLVVGTLLSGSFAVEYVTAWPGLGYLMLQALNARDVFLVAGCAAAGATFLAVGTLVSDLALAWIDPRVRE